jgi:hypothetical protein
MKIQQHSYNLQGQTYGDIYQNYSYFLGWMSHWEDFVGLLENQSTLPSKMILIRIL